MNGLGKREETVVRVASAWPKGLERLTLLQGA